MISAWAFAAAAWTRPGVEAACLELQNVHGQSPALLLWRCWTLQAGRAVSTGTLAQAIETARNCEDEILRPLRALRRRPGGPSVAIAEEAWSALRRRILEAELEVEHALLDALQALADEAEWAAHAAPSPLEALSALSAAWRPPVPSVALIRLIEAH